MANGSERIGREMNVIKLIKKVRFVLDVAKREFSKNDISFIKRGKTSLIDLDSSEASEMSSVKTDSSTDDQPDN